MLWLEQKYLGIVSNRLERFTRKKNNTYNFRCPVCGDSQKNKYKARGWVFPKKKEPGLLYHCHNCSVTMDVAKLIEMVDPIAYKEYVMEKLSESGESRKKSDAEILAFKMKTPNFIKTTPLKNLKKISQLSHTHPAKKYIDSRKIPTPYQAKLFYCPRFKEWTNTIIPHKFKDLDWDEPRLIIPFLDENNDLFGYQGRAFTNNSIRYITIMINENKPKIYGLDTCDREQPHYIFEGPIDSMFIPNSIAMAGGSIKYEWTNSNSIFVFDNEPRSVETCKKIEKCISMGYSVVIFPENVQQKDINEMILNGMSVLDVLKYNVSSGLEAKVLYTAWKRI